MFLIHRPPSLLIFLGWKAPNLDAWLHDSLSAASNTYFKKSYAAQGEGTQHTQKQHNSQDNTTQHNTTHKTRQDNTQDKTRQEKQVTVKTKATMTMTWTWTSMSTSHVSAMSITCSCDVPCWFWCWTLCVHPTCMFDVLFRRWFNSIYGYVRREISKYTVCDYRSIRVIQTPHKHHTQHNIDNGITSKRSEDIMEIMALLMDHITSTHDNFMNHYTLHMATRMKTFPRCLWR
jgi:hypothetical protein